MAAQVIDGRQIANDIREELATRVERLKASGVNPNLIAIVVGEDPASLSYLRGIARGCERVGIATSTITLPENVSQSDLESKIKELNGSAECHGIILQLPLPKHLDALRAQSTVSADKDVDGTHPANTGKLLLGEETFFPSTPYGVQQLLVRSGHRPEGTHVVICGRSNIVGKPLAAILVQKKEGANATVTLCHTGTRDLPSVTRQGDILVAAIGKARAVTADMVADGAVVVDVGVNQVDDPESGKPKLVGDVDYEAVAQKAGAITPVPGGTGPVTTAMLLSNTVTAAEKMCRA